MKIILADPYLTGYSGHCYAYLDALQKALQLRGMGSIILGSQVSDAAFQRETGVRAGFYPYVRETRWFMARFRANFRQNLQIIHEQYALNSESLLVINLLRHFHIVALATWLKNLEIDKRPKVALVLHFTANGVHKPIQGAVRSYRRGLYLLNQLSTDTRIAIYADTQELVDEFQSLTPHLIQLAPIPTTIAPCVDRGEASKSDFEAIPSSEKIKRLSQNDSPKKIRVLFAGEARWDKGFHLLPAAAASISEYCGENAEFIVQAFNPEAKTKGFLRTLEELRSFGVTLVDRPLSGEEYSSLIPTSDIVLMPYSGYHYKYQSSGVFVDAVVSGKIVVAPRETWMGKQIARNGGGVVFVDNDESDFKRAVIEALGSIERLTAEAKYSATEARKFYTANVLADMLLA